jgi:tetrapyrrole methylase family protein/MazG family protein
MHLKFKDLLEICAKLRGEGGCPWDREQTIESIKDCVVEEAQELVDAINNNDIENIEEEMGDLMFCLILMAQIAKEDGKFDMGTVLEKNAEKIISRHTWVFGTDKADTPEEAVELWLKNKAKEKKK